MDAKSEDRIRQLVKLITEEKSHDDIKVLAEELFEQLSAQQKMQQAEGD